MNPILQKINHVVVLMLENRSFDHLLGDLQSVNSKIVGVGGAPSCPDTLGSSLPVKVHPATSFSMDFDPNHEFLDVQMQLYGMDLANPGMPNAPVFPAPMNGFLASSYEPASQANQLADRIRVMEYLPANTLQVLGTLAQQFALFNFWHSSLPGPTWPNRFFVHAATSGGLTDSPTNLATAGGFSFANGTIYAQLKKAGKDWRIYHDGLPQTIGIDSLRGEFLNPTTLNFHDWSFFAEDVSDHNLPEYTFIEPRYNVGSNYVGGTSMHPLDDIRLGDGLVQEVYELLRQGGYFEDTMLVITFDEHGGFFDHLPPPKAVPTGDDTKYANPAHPFGFDLLGVRVPAIVVSAFTAAGTVIGSDPSDASTVFDHTSILRLVEDRFGLASLTARDAKANSIEVALNLANPRTDLPVLMQDTSLEQLPGAPPAP